MSTMGRSSAGTECAERRTRDSKAGWERKLTAPQNGWLDTVQAPLSKREAADVGRIGISNLLTILTFVRLGLATLLLLVFARVQKQQPGLRLCQSLCSIMTALKSSVHGAA
jgi:hypothetical protein